MLKTIIINNHKENPDVHICCLIIAIFFIHNIVHSGLRKRRVEWDLLFFLNHLCRVCQVWNGPSGVTSSRSQQDGGVLATSNVSKLQPRCAVPFQSHVDVLSLRKQRNYYFCSDRPILLLLLIICLAFGMETPTGYKHCLHPHASRLHIVFANRAESFSVIFSFQMARWFELYHCNIHFYHFFASTFAPRWEKSHIT